MSGLAYIKEQIKAAVTVKQVVSRYIGVDVDRGNICCPFHNEKNPSMSVLNDFYYCHSCGAKGDIFSFVMNYLSVNFKDALITIDNDFSLGLTGKKISVAQQVAARKRKKAAEEKKYNEEITKAEYDELCQEYRICEMALNSGALEPLSEMWCYYTELKINLEKKMLLGGHL